MQPTSAPPVSDAQDGEAVLAALGIERIPVDYFHWNGFRYGTLKDAIAAARRAGRQGAGEPS